MARSFEFKHQGRMPGLNEYVKQNRGKSGTFFGNKTKKFLTEDVMKTLAKYEFEKFTGEVVVEFHWVEINRKRDPDNFIFAKKFILDGMVKSGVIPNDGMKNIAGFTDTWEVRSDTNGGVIVTVREY